MSSSIQIPEGTVNGQRVGTITRDEAGVTIHHQAIAVVDPATGLPIPLSTETTLAALKVAVDALSAKIAACDTGAVALDAATITALQTITATINGAVEVANPGLTDEELRAAPVPVTDPALAAIAALHEMMTYYLSAMLEKMPRVDTADRLCVNTSDGSNNINAVASLNGMDSKPTSAIPMHLSNAGAVHLYNNILVS